MKKNTFSELTNEELIAKKNFTKNVLLGFIIIYFVIVAILLFLFLNKNFGELSIALFVPVFVISATLMPLFINYRMLKAELISRNL